MLLAIDPLFGKILSIIMSEDQLKEKWFAFGFELGLTTDQLHDIERRYYESLQRTREVLLQWRVNNIEKSLDPLVDALHVIGLIDLAIHIKDHFINQQPLEDGVYCRFCDKYRITPSQTILPG